MKTTPAQRGTFEKVGECFYRYSSTGTYYAVLRHRGKLIRKSLATPDRPLAKRRLADFRRSIEKVNPKAGRVTVAELADRYRETQRHLAPKTQKKKDTITARIKAEWPEGADTYVRDVRESQIGIWLGLQKPRMGKSAFNDYVEHIRAVFRLAVADKIIADSPAAALKQMKRDKPIRETPSWEQFQAIVESIRNQRLHAECEDSADFVEFLGLAGLGNAEAASLTWGDVDWAKGKIRVYRHKTDEGFVIPIYPQLRPLLERLRRDRTPAPDENVFKIISAKKSLAAACQRLGFAHFSHRAFRRMFISRALEKGIDVQVIASWQGHRDGGKLILQTYSHVRQVHADEMAKRL